MMSSLHVLTDGNFEDAVEASGESFLVEFWASWCPPCQVVEPTLKSLAEEYSGQVRVGKINVDQNPRTRDRFDVAGLPTFILFKEGAVQERATGARSADQLRKMVEDGC